MASAPQGAVLHQLGRLFGRGTVAGLSEWELLSRYLTERDEAAFEALVTRHGPMVLGVCRRLLADPNDVDDAFQATFLVLVRKANGLSNRDAIGHWLYGVARRVALRARSEAAERRRRNPNLTPPAAPLSPEANTSHLDLCPALDEELSRLPKKYRAPIVLCYLEGLTHEEAAHQLQWPLGTVKGRLARARDLLKGRLVRRGVGLSTVLSSASMSRDAGAAIPEALRSSTVATAMKVAAGPITAEMVSASVVRHLDGVLTTMLWTKLRLVAATGLMMALLAAGVGVVAQQSNEVKPDPAAVSDGSSSKNREQGREKGIPAAPPSATKPSQRPMSLTPESGSSQKVIPVTDDPQSLEIVEKLETPVSMSFGNETPLEDVLKYIKSVTTGANDNGIPIYVDPVGLQEAEKTMTSPVILDLEGVPLKTTLDLLLKQLGLCYRVDRSLLIISDDSVENRVTTLSLLEGKVERGEATADEVARLAEMLKGINEIKKLKIEGQKLDQEAKKSF